jgi:hypothetical protein
MRPFCISIAPAIHFQRHETKIIRNSTNDYFIRIYKNIIHIYSYIHITSSEYVILIASPQQQWLSERAPTLRYMYIAPLVALDLALVFRTLLATVVECATIPRPDVSVSYRTTRNAE